MHRYIGIAWSPADATAVERVSLMRRRLRATQRHWMCAFEGSNLIIDCSEPGSSRGGAHPLQPGGGVIVGDLFPNGRGDGDRPASGLSVGAGAEAVRSRGRSLIGKYWGRYVGFVSDPTTGEVCVFRDPLGGLPCYLVHLDGIFLIFSHLQDALDAGDFRPAVNWRYVIGFIRHSHLHVAETGVEGVTEVLPGQRVRLSWPAESPTFLWDPARVALEDPIEDFNRACDAVAATAQECISAWASLYKTILHRLSGGLDSSVVLACLARAPSEPRIICENERSTATPESNELDLARLTARHCGCELIEVEVSPVEARFDRAAGAALTPKPSMAHLSLCTESSEGRRRAGAMDAVTSGKGGDQLFLRLPHAVIAADYIWQRGLGTDCFRVALDTARLARTSVWSVLAQAIPYGTGSRVFRGYELAYDRRTLLTPAALESIEPSYLVHPWLAELGTIPPAKAMHVYAITTLQYFHQSAALAPGIDAPVLLASQPLVEACLRTPTYILANGGIDRAVERAAFASIIPRAIAHRHWKGGSTRHLSRALSSQLPVIWERLVEGRLATAGVIDRQRVIRYLSGSVMIREEVVEPILNCLAAELWLERTANLVNGMVDQGRPIPVEPPLGSPRSLLQC